MFDTIFNRYSWDTLQEKIDNTTEEEIHSVLKKENPSIDDALTLLSPAAEPFLERFAQVSADITRQRFGNTIQLYTPLYVSNECSNACVYCGFNCRNDIERITLSDEEIEKDAEIIYNMGFRHLLLLTGEDRRAVPVEKLASIARSIHKKFASVSIEVYPMEVEEYKILADNGVDGLTLYQETYNREIYKEIHPAGKKRDFLWRLQGPDRGGEAGLRKIGVGTLLGLSDWRIDGFFTLLHAWYLTKTYWRSHIQISFPRLRHAAGDFTSNIQVTDRDLTHLICIMRMFLPDAGLVLSTREPEELRDNLMPLGITMMSAGSKTNPGGYADPEKGENQFDVEDTRSADDIARVIKARGFDPVWKDWDRDFIQ